MKFTPAHGHALLMEAVEAGFLEDVKFLVEKCGVDFHKDHEIALHRAAHHGHLEIVKYLVESGADYNDLDSDGCNAFYRARANWKWSVVDYFRTLRISSVTPAEFKKLAVSLLEGEAGLNEEQHDLLLALMVKVGNCEDILKRIDHTDKGFFLKP